MTMPYSIGIVLLAAALLRLSAAQANCGGLTAPENGFVEVPVTTEGSIAEYSCVSGYELTGNDGDRERVCQADGQWSGDAPTCVIHCGNLTAPENGFVNVIGTSVDARAEYSCESGYELTGEFQDRIRECQANGQWSGVAPTCVIVCDDLNSPENGAVGAYGTVEGSTVEYFCASGYALIGDRERECQSNGQWSGAAPTCVMNAVVDCGTLVDPTNGQVTFVDTTFEADATYTCDESFSLEGVETRTCEADGKWSAVAPVCVSCGGRANISLLVTTLLVLVGLAFMGL